MAPYGLVLALSVLAMCGCSAQTLEPESAAASDPFVGWFKDYRTCRQEYAAMDTRVTRAGRGDAAYYRVPGYPYFRTDRVTASFAREVRTIDEIGGWMRRMRDFDQEAREFEYRNLGLSPREAAEYSLRFHACGAALATVEFLDNPGAFGRLIAAVQPPDEYSTLQRATGLYPIAVSGMRARVARHQKELEEGYAKPVPSESLTLWKPRMPDDLPDLAVIDLAATPDELGFPTLTDGQWRALVQAHAPHLLVETLSAHDVLAEPMLTAQGPGADPDRHRAHYYVTFTRAADQTLPQLNYLFWFPGQDGSASLDGFVWRVTLDLRGDPLVYERMHLSGYGHEWYPVQSLTPREVPQGREAPVIAPRNAPAHLPTIDVASTSHSTRRVLALPDMPQRITAERTYEIDRLEALFSMPSPTGEAQSLFDPEGFVRGPHGRDPFGGRSSGIRRPGALRQLGRHAIAHIGRAHFDDPFLIESVFQVP